MKYYILIAPSSEDKSFLGSGDYDSLRGKLDETQSGQELIFDTREERDAFILGYHSGVGWLGEPDYITKNE